MASSGRTMSEDLLAKTSAEDKMALNISIQQQQLLMTDMYADLIETSEAKEINQLKKELEEFRRLFQEQKEALEAAQQATTTLQKENAVLKTNLSAMYHTAKKEIQRKDLMIAELRASARSVTTTSSSSNPVASSIGKKRVMDFDRENHRQFATSFSQSPSGFVSPYHSHRPQAHHHQQFS